MIKDLTMSLCTSHVEWSNFLAQSPQGTRYGLQEVMHALGCQVDFWFVMHKHQIVAGVPIVVSNSAAEGLPIHTYYIGLMYHNDIYKGKANRTTECEIAISEFVMNELSKKYTRIELSLHHSIADVRGFNWFNYHEPEAGRAQIMPQYTAISTLQPISDIRSEARSSRRREEGYAKTREQLEFSLDGKVQELIRLYVETFKRQTVDLDGATITATEQFAECILAQGFAEIAVVRDEAGEAQAAGLVFYDFSGYVHLPVVGTKETKYGGTLLYFQMMEHAARKGYQYMDFNGANSPNRGYFKHSIGAKAQLFFHVSWVHP